MSDKNWPKHLRNRIRMIQSPCGGDPVVKFLPDEVIELADYISELEAKLAAVEKLPDKWWDEESKAQYEPRMNGSMCADELEAALK